MSKWVLDSSAVLALMQKEPGHEKVAELFADSCLSTVNLAEVLSKLAENDTVREGDIENFKQLSLEIVEFDTAQARKVAELRPLTRHLGLSLGDRCCLALAILRGATALTADRAWKDLDFCSVELIR